MGRTGDRHALGPIMIMCGAAVAAVVGISGNVVADSLPAWLSRWALPAFLIGSLLSVILGVIIYRLDRERAAPAARAGELTSRDRGRLLDGVAGQAGDMLWLPPDDPPPLRLRFQPRADLVSAPRQHFAERLSDDATITAAWEQAEGTLLIVGGPGSGKSRQLAELAAHLVKIARADPDAPVPVLVSLATWAPGRGPLAGWLASELKQRYDVPLPIGTAAVSAGHVQPLLDGLDESADVAACVAAVNAFRDQGHGLVPLVVCSRLVEYDDCGARLRLRGAVELRPPSPDDVRRYLDQAGVPPPTIEALDEDMAELLGTPLTLGLIGRTCRSGGVIELADSTDRAQRWAPLLDEYVTRMLGRVRDPGRERSAGYDDADVRRWLGWLAAVTRDQFRLDRVQPDWLPASGYRVWRLLSRGWYALGPAAMFGLLAGIVAGWAAGRLGLPGPVWWGIAIGLVIAAVMARRTARHAPPPKGIEPAEVLRWQRDELPEAIALLTVTVPLLTVGTSVVTAVIAVATGKPIWATVFSATTLGQLLFFITSLLLFALIHTVKAGAAPASRVPNEGIRRSARHALLAGVPAWALTTVAILAISAWAMPDEFGVGTAVATAAPVGAIVGYQFGGGAVIKHYALRVLLVRGGCAPWRYVRFLDFATERMLLRRVGGAYEFLHPTMRDHLATRSPAPTAATADS